MGSIPWVRYAFVVFLMSSGTMSSLLLPPYLHERGYDYTAIGFLTAITGIAALCSRFPAGAAYRRERARVITTVAVATLGLGLAAYPLANDAFAFSAIQLIVGLSNGVATTVNLAMFMDTLPRGIERSKVMAVYAGALAAGHALGNLIGGIAGDMFGYVIAFQLGGATTVLSLVLLWTDRVHGDIEPSKHEQQREQGAPQPVAERLRGLLRALVAPQLVAISMVAFLLNFFHALISTFFPIYGVSIGLSLAEIGFIRTAHALTNAIVRPLAAAPIQKLGPLRGSYAALAILAVLAALLPTQTWVVMFGLIMIGIGIMRAIALVGNTVQLAGLNDVRMSRGMASSAFHSAQDIGMLSSPALCGAIASLIGLTTMMSVVPIVAAVLFFGLVAMLQARRAPRQVAGTA